MAAKISVRPIRPYDFDLAAKLFAEYPFKSAQRAIQKLDRSRLNQLYLAQLKRSVEAGDPAWIAEDSGGKAALAGLANDSWHSQIYGIKMGKIQPWLSFLDESFGEAMLATVFAAAAAKGYEHLSVRIDGGEYGALHLFERHAFRLVDVSMKFSRPMPFARDLVDAARAGWFLRLAQPEDGAWMRELGSRTHAHTHFLNDPGLAPEKTRALFDAWVARCIEKLAYRIYVLEDSSGAGKGFVIYLRNTGFAKTVGVHPLILDYVIIDPSVRGGGVGPWFVQESLKREADSGFDFCELRTSSHNLAAIGCYEKLAFRLCATDFVLHKKITGG